MRRDYNEENDRRTHRAADMVIVPYLVEDGAVMRAAEIREGSGLRHQGILNSRQRVGRFVAGRYSSAVVLLDSITTWSVKVGARCEHVEGREHIERSTDSKVEVNDILMFLVIRAVALDVKCTRACSVFAELDGKHKS